MWFYKNKEFTSEDIPEDVLGFVYLIHCTETDQYYIGRKQFYSTMRKPPLKGKTRKRKVVKESDWQKYYSSSEEMKSMLLTYGPEAFKREIIALGKTKTELAYIESKFIFETDALLRDNFINKWITTRINTKNTKNTSIKEIKEWKKKNMDLFTFGETESINVTI